VKQFVQNELQHLPGLQSAFARLAVRYHFRPIPRSTLSETSALLANAWRSESIPARQRRVVEAELAAFRRRQAVPVFDALVDIVKRNVSEPEGGTFLEIGCSSGYYSEVLRCGGINVRYHGCDYSAAFIRMARELYGAELFDMEDATSLSYGSSTFDIVMSGCCLLHIIDYNSAIAEASRVAKAYVLFHRTPVLHLSGPTFYTKKAYGQEMVEIHFNEQELVRQFCRNGLHVIDVNTHLSTTEHGRREPLFYKTYLCRKATC